MTSKQDDVWRGEDVFELLADIVVEVDGKVISRDAAYDLVIEKLMDGRSGRRIEDQSIEHGWDILSAEAGTFYRRR